MLGRGDSAAARLVAVTILGAALGAGACSSTPPSGSLEQLKRDQRMAVTMDCRRQPRHYGFPYTREEYRRWRRDVGRWMPDLDAYCFGAARRLVR